MAGITNAADGAWAAQAMAASIAAAVRGEPPDAVVEAGVRRLPEDSWIGRKVRQARALLEEAGGGFAAVPLWCHHVVNGVYNYGNVAPETLAVAYAVFLASGGRLAEGISLAALIPKQADSMPAMVGALAGASQGAGAVPPTWAEALDTLKGVALPYLKGLSLRRIADDLVKESAG
jgi:ADP-ribosylglycohydrolase